MLRSIIIVLCGGMVATSLGCVDIYMTYETPPEACLPPPTPEPKAPEPSHSARAQSSKPLPSLPGLNLFADDREDLDQLVWKCFRVEREAHPGLEGTLIIEFEVADDGSVIPPVDPDTTWAASGDFTSCIQGVFNRHDWPEPGRYVKTYYLR